MTTLHRLVQLPAAALVLLALFALSCPAQADGGTEPPMSTKDLKAIIYSMRDRVVVVNFWASWCAPCRREFPDLMRLRKEFSGEDLHILGISLDFDGEMYAQFASAQRFNYPVRLGDSELMEEMNIKAIPKTLIFDQRGALVQNHDGVATYAELSALVHRLLREGKLPEPRQ